jgi:hypothetical protein
MGPTAHLGRRLESQQTREKAILLGAFEGQLEIVSSSKKV